MSDVLSRLHDATLLSISLDWAEKKCTFEFAGSPSIPAAFRFIWDHVEHLAIPRKDEWGPSVSVLSATKFGEKRYEIQMQSGDLIVVVSPSLTTADLT